MKKFAVIVAVAIICMASVFATTFNLNAEATATPFSFQIIRQDGQRINSKYGFGGNIAFSFFPNEGALKHAFLGGRVQYAAYSFEALSYHIHNIMAFAELGNQHDFSDSFHGAVALKGGLDLMIRDGSYKLAPAVGGSIGFAANVTDFFTINLIEEGIVSVASRKEAWVKLNTLIGGCINFR